MPSEDSNNLLVATFAEATAVLPRDKCIYAGTDKLQIYMKKFENWACRWNIAINSDKCVSVTYTLNQGTSPRVFLHGELLNQTVTLE